MFISSGIIRKNKCSLSLSFLFGIATVIIQQITEDFYFVIKTSVYYLPLYPEYVLPRESPLKYKALFGGDLKS